MFPRALPLKANNQEDTDWAQEMPPIVRDRGVQDRLSKAHPATTMTFLSTMYRLMNRAPVSMR